MATQQPIYIYRLTHYRNLPFILQNGLHCANSVMSDANFINIGFKSLIEKRASKNILIAPGGTLQDYIPFFFCIKPVMLYPIAKGHVDDYDGTQEEIIYLISSAEVVQEAGLQFIFTDRHAFLDYAKVSNNLADLATLDWGKIRATEWGDRHDETRQTKEIKQAEFLVYRHIPRECVKAVACANETTFNLVRSMIQNSGLEIRLLLKPNYYY